MGSYTAIIKCAKCGRVLTEINSYHEPEPDVFVTQDIVAREFELSELFCQYCLNQD